MKNNNTNGTVTPEEIVRIAKEHGLEVVQIQMIDPSIVIERTEPKADVNDVKELLAKIEQIDALIKVPTVYNSAFLGEKNRFVIYQISHCFKKFLETVEQYGPGIIQNSKKSLGADYQCVTPVIFWQPQLKTISHFCDFVLYRRMYDECAEIPNITLDSILNFPWGKFKELIAALVEIGFRAEGRRVVKAFSSAVLGEE